MAKRKTKTKKRVKKEIEIKEEVMIEEAEVENDEPKEEKPKKYVTAPYKEIDYSKPRKKGQLFCCYCGEWQYFKSKQMNGWTTYERCVGCGISTEDFWIKTVNKLWGSPNNNKK